MKYRVEELLSLVKMLAEKYTGKSSTSVTYEVAQQLMGAVLYCMNEEERSHLKDGGQVTEVEKRNSFYSAREAYERGYNRVLLKMKKAKEEYNNLITEFNNYGNIAYYDTIVKGMPEFFRWYNPRLHPQNHILLLDYPILERLDGMNGIDIIYKYLINIKQEQKFPKEYVRGVLVGFHPEYEDLCINL